MQTDPSASRLLYRRLYTMEHFVSILDDKGSPDQDQNDQNDQNAAELTDEDKELLKICHNAKEFAYAPYSQFRVGAALLAENGKIYSGTVEVE